MQDESQRAPDQQDDPQAFYQSTEPGYEGYEPGDNKWVEPAADVAKTPMTEPISWEASEYIHHSKDIVWFVGFGLIVAVLIGVAIWLASWTFLALVVVMAVAFVIFALRQPRVVHYSLTDRGVQIGEKTYDYTDFRAFGVVPDGGIYSVMLVPTKRFMPAVTMYFAEEDGEKIVDVLSVHLPMEEFNQDPIDQLMRRLRF
ncbi:MAG: hypothetical protein ACREGJ_04210 [Candidatus Saccharimonadales bacterium]